MIDDLSLQQANTQSFGYFVTQSSTSGNVILPVLPRFSATGDLINPA